jgi:hypothetical protein
MVGGTAGRENNSEELEAWLRTQPREVAVAFAARAALRVLPVVQGARRPGFDADLFSHIVLPVFRAMAISWAAARYPAHETELAAAADNASNANAANAATANAANAAAYAAASAAANVEYSAPIVRAAAVHAAAAEAAADAYAAAPPLWSAISTDATRAEGVAASVIAGSMLWPLHILQPEPLQSLWQDLKAALLAAKQDWQVWTIWFDDRVASYVRDEERELAYVRIEDALWDQGPAIVNAETMPQESRKGAARRPLLAAVEAQAPRSAFGAADAASGPSVRPGCPLQPRGAGGYTARSDRKRSLGGLFWMDFKSHDHSRLRPGELAGVSV